MRQPKANLPRVTILGSHNRPSHGQTCEYLHDTGFCEGNLRLFLGTLILNTNSEFIENNHR